MNWKYKVDKQVRSLDEIIMIAWELVEKNGPYKVSVAAGEDLMGLGGVALGKERGMIDPILVGHPRRIIESLEKLGRSTKGWNIVEEKDERKATAIAARQVYNKETDVLMRGKLLAYDFLKVLLSRELGIRKKGDLWTNIVLTKLEVLDRLLLITDPAVIVNADLTKRLHHLQVVLEFANFLGIEEPKIALLAAVETVSPNIPVSLEEAVISMMCERGQFAKGIQVDGPLSLDLAINPEAVKKKRVVSKVAGKADILVVNNLGIGNLLFKSLITLCGGISASVIVGLPFPVVLTSRSESPENIQYSLAMSIMMAGGK